MESARAEHDDVPGCRIYVPPPPRYQGEPAAAPGRFDSSLAVREYRQAARRIWAAKPPEPKPEPEPVVEKRTRIRCRKGDLVHRCCVPECPEPLAGRLMKSGRPERYHLARYGIDGWGCSACHSMVASRHKRGLDVHEPRRPKQAKRRGFHRLPRAEGGAA